MAKSSPVLVVASSQPQPFFADVTIADQIVRCGGCKLLFRRTGMIVEHRPEELWCAWCIAEEDEDHHAC